MTANILKAVAVVAELTQTDLSKDALRVMVADLSRYPEPVVLQALQRCRVELTGKLSMAAVMARINDADGRPTADEAWAMALDARDEAATVVWTDEVQEAFALARPVLDAGDKVGARMAFRDAYERLVRDARLACRSPHWSASLGWNKELRAVVLTKAAETGQLSTTAVAQLLPAPDDVGPVMGSIFEGRALPAPEDINSARVAERCEQMRRILRRPTSRPPPVREDMKELARKKAEIAATVAEYVNANPKAAAG